MSTRLSPAAIALAIAFAVLIPAPALADLESLPAWTCDGNQAGAWAANCVATAGDVNGDGYSDLLVGAPNYSNGEFEEGMVWLYLGGAAGPSDVPAWSAEGNQVVSTFGTAVACAGDVNNDGYDDVLVGAPGYDDDQSNEGRVFLYLGSASGLSATPDWTRDGNQVDGWFGQSVAGAGDVNGDGYDDVIAGGHGFDNVQVNEGRAFVYRGNATGLGWSPVWTGEPNVAGAYYGFSVASAGDVNGDGLSDIIVGAPVTGRSYVYLGNSSGVDYAAIWTGSGDAGAGSFGFSVSGAGDVDGDGYADVIVGAPDYDGDLANEGKAYTYHGSASGVGTTAAWTCEGNGAEARFGRSVSVAGDTDGDGYADVIIGAPGFNGGQTGEGKAFLFSGSYYGLEAAADWTDESDQSNAWYGKWVASAGDVDGDGRGDVLVGAYFHDDGEDAEGRAYLYLGKTEDADGAVAWYMEPGQPSARYGFAVAFAGDVNGDSFGDVIIGAPLYDHYTPDEGWAEVHHGGPNGVYNNVSWSGEGNEESAYYGNAVCGAGDINGDGYDDIAVGCPGASDAFANEGQAYIYLGSSTGVADSPVWAGHGLQANADYGYALAPAGDVNGDGYGDLIVGAHYYDAGQTNEGRAFVYLGTPSGVPAGTVWTAESNQANANFGWSVAGAGDVNGDGYSDVLVGAPNYTNGEVEEGRVYLYLGSSAGLGAAAAWTAESNQAQAGFGVAVAGAGDINGDGYSDVVIGAPDYDLTEADEGRVAVYLGGAAGLAAAPAWTRYGYQAAARYGGAVAAAGDVNADGHGDIIVGAKYYDDPEVNEGRTYLYLGTPTGPMAYAVWTLDSDQAGALYGSAVDGAGDVNGDGFSDLLIGAMAYSNGESGEGRVFAYYGNQGDGRDRIPGQRRANDAAKIGLLGKSESNQAFRLTMRGRTPAGRGIIRMACEVKPLGVAFNGAGVTVEDPVDTGAPQGNSGSYVSLNALCGGLIPATPYHWRMRVLSDSPFFPRSPWLTHPGNCASETDLRTGGSPLAVDGDPDVFHGAFSLHAAPNPARDQAGLTLVLRRGGPARIEIFDAQGRRVAGLLHADLPAGTHALFWDGRDDRSRPVGSGVYFARCTAGGSTGSVQLVLTR